MCVTMNAFCTVGFISPVMVKSCHSPAKLRIVNLLVLCEKLQRKSILTLYLYHFVSFYSSLKLSTGLARAACAALKLTVSNAVITVATPANTSIHHCKSM